MGGFGSGRYGGKLLCESCCWFDARRWAREGLLVAGKAFSVTWSNGSNINVQTYQGRVELRYSFNGQSNSTHAVRVLETPCNFGGTRYWFGCTRCGNRCAKLFLRNGRFACRACQRLRYRSQSLDAIGRQHLAHGRLEAKLAQDGNKPKGMHWRTYENIRMGMDDQSAKINETFCKLAARFMRKN